MNKVREIVRLAGEDGLSERAISRAVRVSRPVVSHYLTQARRAGLRWSQIAEIDDDELLRRGGDPQPDPRLVRLVEMLPHLLDELSRPGVTRQLLWEEYREKHPDGYSYTQFCFHIQTHTETAQLSMHLEHEPGNRLFVDFAGTKPVLCDPKTGLEIPVELFVAVVPASGLIYAEAVESQELSCFCSGTRGALEYIGGAPKIIVPDNLKAAVTTPDRFDPLVNETYQDFARHYGCAVMPARSRRSKDKALVEAAVNLRHYLNDISSDVVNQLKGEPPIDFGVECLDTNVPVDVALHFGLIVTEAVSNAMIHAFDGDFPDGRVSVSLRGDGDQLILEVSDNGRGDSGSNRVGLGLQLIEMLVAQHQGALEVAHERGTSVICRFPAATIRG